jgi:hypothetical protein
VKKPAAPTDADRLRRLLKASHPLILIQTTEEEHAGALVRKAALDLNLSVVAWTMSRGIHDPDFSDTPLVPEGEGAAGALQRLLKDGFERQVILLFDLVEHLEDGRTARLLRDLAGRMRKEGGHVALVDARGNLPPALDAEATRFELSLPDETELQELVKETLGRERRRLKGPPRMSSKLWPVFLRNLRGLTRRQARQVVLDVISDDGEFDDADLNRVLARKRELLQRDGLLQFVEAPETLDEVAGLTRFKAWLSERKNALGEEGRLFGLEAPRGVLMLGVPGSGKSLCAKAVASAWKRPLFRLDPAALYDKYIGESERNLRQALHAAEAMSPVVLWIDEVEKGFAGAASRSVDGGLSQRLFGSLLTWFQEHRAPVFVVATANDIEALPAELLRKGRFDEIFFVDLPGAAARRDIAAVHLRKRQFDPSAFDLDAVAAAAEGHTGAEIEQAVVAALHSSYGRTRKMATADLLEALRASPPLSRTMHERVESLRAWAQGRCVPAD